MTSLWRCLCMGVGNPFWLCKLARYSCLSAFEWLALGDTYERSDASQSSLLLSLPETERPSLSSRACRSRSGLWRNANAFLRRTSGGGLRILGGGELSPVATGRGKRFTTRGASSGEDGTAVEGMARCMPKRLHCNFEAVSGCQGGTRTGVWRPTYGVAGNDGQGSAARACRVALLTLETCVTSNSSRRRNMKPLLRCNSFRGVQVGRVCYSEEDTQAAEQWKRH